MNKLGRLPSAPRHSAPPEPVPVSALRASVTGAATLQLVPDPVASILPPFEWAEGLLEEAEATGRAYRIEVRPSFTEGQYLGLALRMWGEGHWNRRDGEPHHYTDRVHAKRAAQRWMESGR